MLLTPVINISGGSVIRSLDVYANICFIFFALFLSVNKGVLQNRAIFIQVYGALALLFVQIIFLELIYGYGDTTGIAIVLRSCVTIFAAYGCVQLLIKKFNDGALPFFLKVVIIAAIIQGVVLWLTFFNSDFRDLMSQLFFRDLSVGKEHLVLLRTPGFVPTGGDGLSMNQSLLAVVGLMGAYVYYPKSRFLFSLVGLLLFSIFSTMFSGQSGFYLGVFFASIIIATQKHYFQFTRKFLNIFIVSMVVITTIFLLAEQLGSYGQHLLDHYGYEHPLVRLLRGFIEMQSTGQYFTPTGHALLTDMVIIPKDTIRFLVGNNDFGQLAGRSIASDVGYFRMWHGLGLVGITLFLLPIFIFPLLRVRILLQKIKCHAANSDAYRILVSEFRILLFVLIFGLIANYKIFYLSSRIFIFVFFVLLFLIYHKYRASRIRS